MNITHEQLRIVFDLTGAVGGFGMMFAGTATIARAIALIRPPATRQSSPLRRLHLVAVGGKATTPPPPQVRPVRNLLTLYLALRRHIRVTAAFTCLWTLSLVVLSGIGA